MTDEMKVVAICQEFSWTYYEYLEQPSWFLDLLDTKLQIDSEKIKKETDKARMSYRK